MSLICGSMSWLRDFNRRQFENTLNDVAPGEEDEPAWVREHTRNIKEAELLERIREFESNLERVREKETHTVREHEVPRKRVRQNVSIEKDVDCFLLKDEEVPAIDATTSALLASLEEGPTNDLYVSFSHNSYFLTIVARPPRIKSEYTLRPEPIRS